jgi:hypothetical protein
LVFDESRCGMIQEYGRDSILIENVECVQEYEKAVVVVVDEDYEEHSIPKSQLHRYSDIQGLGDSGNLIITKWIAEKRGLWREGA